VALAIVVLAERADHGRARSSVTVTQKRGPAKVAAAYGYPLRCLSGASLAADDAYPRADLKHLILCGQYPGYPAEGFRDLTQARRPMLVQLALPGTGR
jgi:hypothetical protein